jgi:Ser/Thr protein kinase RdoA (MazF antagonist)
LAEEINEKNWLALVEENYDVTVQGEPVLLNERSGQRVYRVDTETNGTLTVRLCTPERSYERVLAATEVLNYLTRQDFPAPELRLTIKGAHLFPWKPAAWGYVHTFIEGETFSEMTLPALRELGGLLGQLHTMADPADSNLPRSNWLDERQEALEWAESCINDPKWGAQAVETAEVLRNLPELHGLPTGLIHTDAHEGNLVRSPNGKLYLLDWEDAGVGELVLDLALVLGWLCVWPVSKNLEGQVIRYDFDYEWSRAFLSAYQQIRPLESEEAEKLGAAIKYVIGWFAARDIPREIKEPGITAGLGFTNWAIMHSVTPEWEKKLTQWANETRGLTTDED